MAVESQKQRVEDKNRDYQFIADLIQQHGEGVIKSNGNVVKSLGALQKSIVRALTGRR